MNGKARACIAYILGRLITGKDSAGVFEVSQSVHFGFSGNVTSTSVSIHDYERNCAVVGKGDGSRLHLHDFGSDSELSFKIKGKQFSGYEDGTSKHFNGSVTSNSVSIYDYEDSTWHRYSF
jgi:hypothetical protein